MDVIVVFRPLAEVHLTIDDFGNCTVHKDNVVEKILTGEDRIWIRDTITQHAVDKQKKGRRGIQLEFFTQRSGRKRNQEVTILFISAKFGFLE